MTDLKEKTKHYVSGGRDSLQKVVDVYFASVAAEPFTFAGNEYLPKKIKVSPSLLRGFSCVENCGACCRDFTLDFLPSEKEAWHPNDDHIQLRIVNFSGRDVEMYTDWNLENPVDKFNKIRCKHLNMNNGRCGIHMRHPLSCDFELLRFFVSKDSVRLGHQLFGRGWNMQRVTDGERGALCSMLDRTEEDRQDSIRKLERLKGWTDHFGLKTHLETIINWTKTIPLNHEKHLIIDPNKSETLERFIDEI